MVVNQSANDSYNNNQVEFSGITGHASWDDCLSCVESALSDTRTDIKNCLSDLYSTKALTKQFGSLYYDSTKDKLHLVYPWRYDKRFRIIDVEFGALMNNKSKSFITEDIVGNEALSGEDFKQFAFLPNGLDTMTTNPDIRGAALGTLYGGAYGISHLIKQLYSNYGIISVKNNYIDQVYDSALSLNAEGNDVQCERNSHTKTIGNRKQHDTGYLHRFGGLYLFSIITGVSIDTLLLSCKKAHYELPDELVSYFDSILSDKFKPSISVKQYLPYLQACFIGGVVPEFKGNVTYFGEKGTPEVNKDCQWSTAEAYNSMMNDFMSTGRLNIQVPLTSYSQGYVAWDGADELAVALDKYIDACTEQLLMYFTVFLSIYQKQTGGMDVVNSSENYTKFWNLLIKPITLMLLANSIYVSDYDSSSTGTLRFRLMTGSLPLSLTEPGSFIGKLLENGGTLQSYNYMTGASCVTSGGNGLKSKLSGQGDEDAAFRPCGNLFGSSKGANNVTAIWFNYDGGSMSALPRSATFTYVFDEKAFEASTLFGYEAIDMMARANIVPSMSKVYIGRAMSGKFHSLDFEKCKSISIAAGSRSGKGTLTNCVIGSILQSGNSLVYLDGKPDVGTLIMKLGEVFQQQNGQYNTPVLVVDGYKLPFKSRDEDIPFDTIGGVNSSSFIPTKMGYGACSGNVYKYGVPDFSNCFWNEGRGRVAYASMPGHDAAFESLLVNLDKEGVSDITSVGETKDPPYWLASLTHIKLLSLLYAMTMLKQNWLAMWVSKNPNSNISRFLDGYCRLKGKPEEYEKIRNYTMGKISYKLNLTSYIFVDEINNVSYNITTLLHNINRFFGDFKPFLLTIKEPEHPELYYFHLNKLRTRQKETESKVAKFEGKKSEDALDALDSVKKLLSEINIELAEAERKVSVYECLRGLYSNWLNASKASDRVGDSGFIDLKFVYVGQQISSPKFGLSFDSDEIAYLADGKIDYADADGFKKAYAGWIDVESADNTKKLLVPGAIKTGYQLRSTVADLKLRGRQYCEDDVFGENCNVDNISAGSFTGADKKMLNLTGVFKPFIRKNGEYKADELVKSFAVFNANDVFDGLENENIECVVKTPIVDKLTGNTYNLAIKGNLASVVEEINKSNSALGEWFTGALKEHSITGRSMAVVNKDNEVTEELKKGWSAVFRGLVSQIVGTDNQAYVVANKAVGFEGFIDKFINTDFKTGKPMDRNTEEAKQHVENIGASLSVMYDFISCFLSDIGVLNSELSPYHTVEEWLYDFSVSSLYSFEGQTVEELRSGFAEFIETMQGTKKQDSNDDSFGSGFGVDVDLFNSFSDETTNNVAPDFGTITQTTEFTNNAFGDSFESDDSFDDSDTTYEETYDEQDYEYSEEPEVFESEVTKPLPYESEVVEAEEEVHQGTATRAETSGAVMAVNMLVPLLKGYNAIAFEYYNALKNNTMSATCDDYTVQTLSENYHNTCDKIRSCAKTVADFDAKYGLETLVSKGLGKRDYNEFLNILSEFTDIFKTFD